MNNKMHGRCLCEAVKFSFLLKERHFDACHCSMCRKWGGGPQFTCESAGEIEFQGEENITAYKSSKWAERGFCKKCGTHLFYRLQHHDYTNFNLGLLDEQGEFLFTNQIYTDFKPDYYEFANQTKMMTSDEVLEAFGYDKAEHMNND